MNEKTKTKNKISQEDRDLLEEAISVIKDKAPMVLATITETVKKEGKGPAGQRVKEMKGGGLAEATAKLKAKGLKEGGMVVKDKIVAIDKSPNSGLITTKGFGAGRRT